ncbi:hypothetical protein ACN2AU_09120 [Aerococcus viridans]
MIEMEELEEKYEELKKNKVKEIWEVSILDTKKGTRRLDFALVDNQIEAVEKAKEFKEKLNSCNEVVVALMVYENGKFDETFGRILYRK